MSTTKPTFTPYGAVGSVTGALFLLQTGTKKYLIDCGLHQGERFCSETNLQPFPFEPSKIDAVYITHAHIDHIGRLPSLVAQGFNGPIYLTQETKEISAIMLDDSLGVLTKEAIKCGHEPLYTEHDVKATVKLFQSIEYHKSQKIADDFSVEFYDAGHILGSAMIKFTRNGKSILFTGDLGNSPAPLLKNTDTLPEVDYLVMESVYGDRDHETVDERTQQLKKAIKETVQNGGALVIPAFSLERTQVLLYEINKMVENGEIPPLPVFVDSPLAIKVTDIYARHIQHFKESVKAEINAGDNIFDFPNLKLTLTRTESKSINNVKNPKIIMAGAGMSQGGRINYHEKLYLPDPQSTVLFVGYQSAGSLGRKLLEGIKTVKIFDENVPVRANIREVRGYSAHKDSTRLVEFMEPSVITLKKVFVVMGEIKSSMFLAQKLRDNYDVDAFLPELGREYELEL